MTWYFPSLPRQNRSDKIAYWQRVLEIPVDEPGAPMLRLMAAERLVALKILSPSELRKYQLS